jgi:hypothetical protein
MIHSFLPCYSHTGVKDVTLHTSAKVPWSTEISIIFSAAPATLKCLLFSVHLLLSSATGHAVFLLLLPVYNPVKVKAIKAKGGVYRVAKSRGLRDNTKK